MTDARTYCSAAARAIYELDRCSLGAPETGQDKADWHRARSLLLAVLDRNGYDLATGSNRIRKRPVGRS